MIEATAKALARHRTTATGARLAAIDAALTAGGYDPETVEPDSPQGYTERACSDARAVNPAYLSQAEIEAGIAAWERWLGGEPF